MKKVTEFFAKCERIDMLLTIPPQFIGVFSRADDDMDGKFRCRLDDRFAINEGDVCAISIRTLTAKQRRELAEKEER